MGNERRSLGTLKMPILKWWWVLVAGAIGALLTAGAMWLLLTGVVAQGNAEVARAQLDAVRTALSLAVGTGGGLALWLAARRQRTSEMQLVESNRISKEAKAHNDRVASATEVDLVERRITDLYTKAVEQLGSEKAPVRLGGLYALERLAQDYAGHRQTVVDVICAYLKMPFSVTSDIDSEFVRRKPYASGDQQDYHSELLVRQTAQDILIRNLRHGSSSWEGIDIDLRGAVLVDFRFMGCHVKAADFAYARFVDTARFDDTVFDEDVWFFHVHFDACSPSFFRTQFKRRAIFTGADFGVRADFDEALFESAAVFVRAVFRSRTSFRRCHFNDEYTFERCKLKEITAKHVDAKSFGPVEFLFDEVEVLLRSPFEGERIEPPGWHMKELSDVRGVIVKDSTLSIGIEDRAGQVG